MWFIYLFFLYFQEEEDIDPFSLSMDFHQWPLHINKHSKVWQMSSQGDTKFCKATRSLKFEKKFHKCPSSHWSHVVQASPLTIIIHRFYIVLCPALQQILCTHVGCDSECVAASFHSAYFWYPPKWCTDSTLWLLHGWCHVKLLQSGHKFCVHHSGMHPFTVSLHSRPHR